MSLESPVMNPAFDVTPATYISGIITERGILKPEDLGSEPIAQIERRSL